MLSIDTTGFTSGTWPLILGAANFNDASQFVALVNHGANIYNPSLNITDGSISIVGTSASPAVVPEPSSIVLATLGLLGVCLVAARRRSRAA